MRRKNALTHLPKLPLLITESADEATLERSVGSDIFEMPDDGLISKAVTPSAA